MGAAHEGWWTELGLESGASGAKAFDARYWEARLGPLRQYPPVGFRDPETGETLSVQELRARIREAERRLHAERNRGRGLPTRDTRTPLDSGVRHIDMMSHHGDRMNDEQPERSRDE